MVRGIADVLDAYVAPAAPWNRAPRLLVAVDPGGFVAARVAARLVAALPRARGSLGLVACDPAAAALLGAAEGLPTGTFAESQVLLATCSPTPRADAVLWISTTARLEARGSATSWAGPPDASHACVAIGAPSDPAAAPRGAVTLATLSAHTALRIALGGDAPALPAASDAVARWLAAPRPPAS